LRAVLIQLLLMPALCLASGWSAIWDGPYSRDVSIGTIVVIGKTNFVKGEDFFAFDSIGATIERLVALESPDWIREPSGVGGDSFATTKRYLYWPHLTNLLYGHDFRWKGGGVVVSGVVSVANGVTSYSSRADAAFDRVGSQTLRDLKTIVTNYCQYYIDTNKLGWVGDVPQNLLTNHLGFSSFTRCYLSPTQLISQLGLPTNYFSVTPVRGLTRWGQPHTNFAGRLPGTTSADYGWDNYRRVMQAMRYLPGTIAITASQTIYAQMFDGVSMGSETVLTYRVMTSYWGGVASVPYDPVLGTDPPFSGWNRVFEQPSAGSFDYRSGPNNTESHFNVREHQRSEHGASVIMARRILPVTNVVFNQGFAFSVFAKVPAGPLRLFVSTGEYVVANYRTETSSGPGWSDETPVIDGSRTGYQVNVTALAPTGRVWTAVVSFSISSGVDRANSAPVSVRELASRHVVGSPPNLSWVFDSIRGTSGYSSFTAGGFTYYREEYWQEWLWYNRSGYREQVEEFVPLVRPVFQFD
jgi:hypothetical protein